MPLQKRPIAADDIKHIAVVSEPHISEEGTKYAFIKKMQAKTIFIILIFIFSI
ncbi:hypothetical protein [Sinobaca sp. H24]|uniref:hypothetical protein n=1 Tax=Sinobaca sp. H24 TaxID=2923376 RepID=UPI0027E35B9A|nr:hypothetical protein [Sinobaca sp. H24]